MIIKALRGFNWAKHEKFEFECDGSIVGVLGKNGSGKSSILTLVEFLITGDARDNLDTYVRNGEGNGGGEMTFQKYGKLGTIMRQVGSTKKRKLEWDGQTYTKAADVDRVMSEIFGADKKALANSVFVNQGTLEDILFREGADRKKAFIKLVNLSYCEARARMVSDKIEQIGSTVIDLTPAKDEAQLAKNTAEAAVARLDTDLAGTRDCSGLLEVIRDRNAAMGTVQLLTTQIGELQIKLDGKIAELQVQTAGKPSDEVLADMAALETEVETKRQAMERYRSILGELTHYRQLEADIDAGRRQVVAKAGEIRTLNGGDMTVEARESKIQEFEEAINSHEWAVHFDGQLVAKQTEFSQSTSRIAALTSTLDSINPSQLALGDVDDTITNFQQRIESHNWYAYQDAQLKMSLDYEKKLSLELENLAPAPNTEEIATVDTKLSQMQNQAALLKRYEEMQVRIARCLGEACEDKSACPECGLTIAGTFQLSNDELYAKSQLLVTLNTEIANFKQQLADLRNQVNHREAEVRRISGLIVKSRNDIKAYRAELAKHSKLEDVEAAQAEILRLQELRPKVSELEQKLHDENVRVDTLCQEIGQIQEQQGKYQKHEDVQALIKSRDDLKLAHAEIARRAIELENLSTTLRNNMAAKSKYPLAIEFWTKRNHFTGAELTKLQNELTGLQTRLQQLRQVCSLIQSIRGQIETLNREVNDKQTAWETANGVVNADLPAELTQPDKTLVQIEAEMMAEEQRRRDLLASRATAVQNYQDCNVRFQDIIARMAENQTKVDLLADLRKLKGLLSDDGLPLTYVKYRFDQLTVFTQEGLTKMNADFYVGANPEQPLEFTFHRLDEAAAVEMPMHKLSGGQRVRLCISFLLALQKALIKDVGLLVLDEPLVHTDEQGIEQIVAFLSDMRNELKNAEHQIWVVDHNPKLATALDKKLQLN